MRHCLEKDRDNRFQTAKDVAFALSEASAPTTTVTSGTYVIPAFAQPRQDDRRSPPASSPPWPSPLRCSGPGRGPARLASASKPGMRRVAVLPFENLGAAEDDYFADGIADAIRGKLTSLPGLQVIARGSSTPYKKTTKTPQEIAKELDAHYLLTATVRWQKGSGGNRVQVSPELVEIGESGAPTSRWQQPFDAALTDVFQVQSEIATKVAESLGGALGAGEEKRLAEKPTENLAAYDAFLKGESASNGLSATDPATLRKALAFYDQAVALDPNFAQAWARVGVEASLLYSNATPTPELADRARQAADRAIALAPSRPDGYLALSYYQRIVARDVAAAREACAKGLRIAPNDAALISAAAAAAQTAGLWDEALDDAREAERLDPRSVVAVRRLGIVLILVRRYDEAREVLDQALALAPSNLMAHEVKAMTSLGVGDLSGARTSFQQAARIVDPAALVAYVANAWDLGWALDEEQQQLLLRLTPDAFDGDRTSWGICLAQAYALKGDTANMRKHAEESRKAFEEELRQSPLDAQRHVLLGLSLAYLGRKDEAIREGRRGVELMPVSKDAFNGPYMQHQLARIYLLGGEPEKALENLEPLLKIPYFLSPGWLKIDPNFDPLRGNPRFERLVAGK